MGREIGGGERGTRNGWGVAEALLVVEIDFYGAQQRAGALVN